MLRLFSEPSRRLFLLKTVLPLLLAALGVFAAAASLMVWAAGEADRVSVERQDRLMALVLSQLQASVAHDQESSTVWDDAVREVRKPDSAEWIDDNLGSWMNSYFGHDGAFVLDPRDVPIFSLLDGAKDDAVGFWAFMTEARPLVGALREKLRTGSAEGVSDRVLSPGVSDLTVVSGRPAVISVKPIVSDSGEIVQTPGQEYLHIAVRFLDGSFLANLQRDYLFEGLRFVWTDDRAGHEASRPLLSARGRIIGHLVWQPYLPGTAVLARIGPFLLALALAAAAAGGLLLSGLRRRSLGLRASQAQVHHLARHDILTGLPNRGQFEEQLDAALRRPGRKGGEVALLYLDLDRFKQVNDTFGHPAGDEVLKEFANRLRGLTRDGDTVSRLGGDEFTVVLRAVRSRDAVEGLCRRIIETARHPFEVAGTQAFIGVSIGVALSGPDRPNRVELTRRADVALYQAKAAGRSAYAVYAGGMDASINTRRGIERDLRLALDTPGQLLVHYQPLFSAGTDTVTGVEALLRWRHPERGWVPPDIFIPLAEEAGLIDRLGERVLREACETAARWPVESIAVNVSAVEMRSPAFAMRVANILLAAGLAPGRLELELTESALADKGGQCERNIAALRELGVRIALDDFGTGFSSLGRLHQLEVDRIKIDRSFVQGFGKANGDEAIVQAIVDLARATGLKTTAEGVETPLQKEHLAELGCDTLQGFLLSRPMPAAEVERLWTGAAEKSSA